MKDIFETIAKNNGTTAEKVREEIIKALAMARSSDLPSAAEFWKDIDENATPEEIISLLCSMAEK